MSILTRILGGPTAPAPAPVGVVSAHAPRESARNIARTGRVREAIERAEQRSPRNAHRIATLTRELGILEAHAVVIPKQGDEIVHIEAGVIGAEGDE